MTRIRLCQLNDAQKGDLAQLWLRHAPIHTISLGGNSSNQESSSGGRSGRGGRGRGGRGGRGNGSSGVAPTTVVTMEMGDEDYTQICRLYSFFRGVVCSSMSSQRVNVTSNNGAARTVTPSQSDEDAEQCTNSRTRQSILFLFKKISYNRQSEVANNVNVVPAGQNENETNMIPRTNMGGNQIISFNHTIFLQELSLYENGPSVPTQHSNNDFALYLQRSPNLALASVGCAIGLVILSLWRKNQSLPLQNNRRHPDLSTLETAIYKPRFYHLDPSSHVRMAHVRTDTVDCLISLRGTVTKARPKRLRVLDAGFTCSKCGCSQICKFISGKYSSPTRCADMKCRSQKFVLSRKVANFVDVQELRIQEVREEFCEDLGIGGGMGGDVNRESGRAPRHMEVEVGHDLVDTCQAGDSIVVVGVVRAINQAFASGRAGKRAAETSTYKLYVVAHSIVNLTAEDGSRGGQVASLKRTMREEADDENGQNKRQRMGSSAAGKEYTDQQLEQIANIAHADHRFYTMPTRMAFPFDLLVRSLCPSIIGNDLVKAGMILCLLGGTPPQVSGLESNAGMTIRSNSHMLIVGDPGMGKSQMLLSANQVASRSVYVGGNTASSTGLTVSLTKETGGDMGIEAGALVLADRGICCLDELDKMPKAHQDGLLEAMEQQQVSIAKAGVVASLPSRCSVIAAANPKSGHYNMSKSVIENLSMAGPLLSRFDLVFILRDEADKERDRLISGSIMGRVQRGDRSHNVYNVIDEENGRFARAMDQYLSEAEASARSRPPGSKPPSERVPLRIRLPWVSEFQKQPLPMQQVKDYIAYAREHCRPQMTSEAATVLHSYFMQLRHAQSKDDVPITTRQLESLIRLSQARAKACLRDAVLREDAEDVVELMIESAKQVHMDENGRIDKARGGVGGKSKQIRDFLDNMRQSGKSKFEFSELNAIAGKMNLPLGDFKDFIETLRGNGDIYRIHDGDVFYYSLAS